MPIMGPFPMSVPDPTVFKQKGRKPKQDATNKKTSSHSIPLLHEIKKTKVRGSKKR